MKIKMIALLAVCLNWNAHVEATQYSCINIITETKAIPDHILMSLYRREMKTESGRVKWHGKRVKTVEDLTNLVQTITYEDGTTYCQPFSKAAPLTVNERFALERKRQEKAFKKRMSQLPPGLQKIEQNRQANSATTNEVTVHYGQVHQ